MSTPSQDPKLVVDRIVSACKEQVPELPKSMLASAATSVGGPHARTWLVRELASKPDLLISGRSDASPTAYRLIKELRSRGFENIQLPRCSTCGRAQKLPHKDDNGGKRCATCNRRATTPDCTTCGKVRKSGYRIIDGAPYCVRCANQDARRHENCALCGNLDAIVGRKNNQPVCSKCYSPPPVTCSYCGDTRPAAIRNAGKPLCTKCNQSLRKKPRVCPRCGEYRITPYLREDGPICPSCADQYELGKCAGCCNDQRPLQGNYCSICVAPRLLRTLISNDDGTLHPQLLALESYLLRNENNADAVVSWARRSPMRRVIHDMATNHTPISLRAVAEHPAGGATGHLAALLMESGVVPTENFDRIRLEVWQEEYFATLPNPTDRSLLKQYSAWIVNPRFAHSAHLSTKDESLRHRGSKAHLIAVAELLGTLDDLNLDLGTIPQRIFDAYVANRGRTGKQLTPFIRWARTRGLTRLNSEYLKSDLGASGVSGASDDERWAWVKNLLAAEDIGLSSRVGGLLALIYGTALTRVVSLRCEAVILDGDSTYILLGTDPIKLPDAVGSLLRQLLDATPTGFHDDDTWLFKGRRPGRHLTTAALRLPLTKKGINIRAAKNVALVNLSRDLPPSVLADLQGNFRLRRGTLECTKRPRLDRLPSYPTYDRTRLGINTKF